MSNIGHSTAMCCISDVDLKVSYRATHHEIEIVRVTVGDLSGSQANIIALLSREQIGQLERQAREDWADELEAMADHEAELKEQMAVL